jgi:nitrogen regulatory protein PII
MYMVMYVLNEPDRLDEVLDAWEAVGVSGVTIVESTGIQRRRCARRRRIPLRFGFECLPQDKFEGHYTLFTIVTSEEQVQKCIAAVEQVVGDLSDPHTGVLASWALEAVKGVPKNLPQEQAL